MPVIEGPDELEVKDFYFKQVIKFRVGSGRSENQRLNILAVSNKYGLTFVGTQTGFVVYKTSEIVNRGNQLDKAASTIIEDLEKWADVPCNGAPTFVSLSADDLTLAVCVKENSSAFAHLYDVRAFVNKDAKPAPFLSARLSATGADLQDFAWNPSSDFSSMFISCMSDGNLGLWVVKDMNLNVAAGVADAGATCVCWSPKGKQVAVGKKDGTIVQFDHLLKVKKVIPGPTGLAGDPVKILDLLWQSTHVFMTACVPQDVSNTEPPSLVIISVPKGEEPKHYNYEDVCYGGADDRKHRYYFLSLAEWDMVVTSSAAAAESCIMGRNAQNALWERWSLDDSGRAEMPLTDDHRETYPIGIALDFTQQQEILISDTMKHPPSPLFMALSTDGVLMVYHMINKQQNAKSLNVAVQALTSQGERKSATSVAPAAPAPKPATTEPPKFAGIFGGGATGVAGIKPLGGVTAGAQAPSTGFSFGGSQPAAISFAKPAAQISANANAQKSAFSLKPAEASPGAAPGGQPPAPPAFGSAFSSMPEGGSVAAFKPPAPVQPATQPGAAPPGFSFAKPASTFGTPVSTQEATKRSFTPQKQPTEIKPISQLPAAGLTMRPQAPQMTTQSPAKITANLPSSTAAPPRGMVPNITQAKPAETPGGISKGVQPVPQQPLQPKPQASVAPVRSPTKHSADGGGMENPFLKSIMDEMKDFNRELLEMKKRSFALKVDIGTREEQVKLRERTNSVSAFCEDIKLTMKSLNEDVHSLKSDCLEGFALIEECHSRQQKSSDPRYQQLLASRALDPLSTKRMKEIRTQLQYVDNSIRDVDGRLDEHWEHYMNKQNKSRKMYVPLSDTIYQTIKNNNSIYNNQCKLLDQLTSQLQELKVTNKSSWQPTPGTPSGGRPVSMTNSPMFSPSVNSSSPLNSTQSPTACAMSPEKSARLRDYLGKRRVTPVKATAPANLSMSKIASAESLRHSLLEDSGTPPFSPEVTSSRERVINNDFRSDISSSTPLRPITTGARQIGNEPSIIQTITKGTSPSAPIGLGGISGISGAGQRLTEGFQRIPEGSSQGAPRISAVKTSTPIQLVKDAPNGAAATKPGLPTFGTTANLPKPVFSFGATGSTGAQSGVASPALSGLVKPPAEGSAAGKPQASSTALTMTLGPGGATAAAVTMPTIGTTRTTAAAPPSFNFGITSGIAKPAAGFTFGASGSATTKPADKPPAPSGTYKPTVEDITPPGTPPVEREEPEGFQQDDEYIPTVPKPAKPDASNTMLKNLLVGSSTAVTKTTAVTTTTASITSHPSRSMFTVGAESGPGADFKSPSQPAARQMKFAQGSPAGASRVTKNLFGTVSGQASGGAASGTDSGPVSFSIVGKGEGESESGSSSSSPQQLDDDDAAEGQDANAGSEPPKPSSQPAAIPATTPATSGFSFSLGTAPSSGGSTSTVAGFSFKQPSGGQPTSIFGGTGGASSTKPSMFGGSSGTQGSFGFGKLGGTSSAGAVPTSSSASSGIASDSTPTVSTVSVGSVSSTTDSAGSAVSAVSSGPVSSTGAVSSDSKIGGATATSAVSTSGVASSTGFSFAPPAPKDSTATSAVSSTTTADNTSNSATASAPGFSFAPTSSLFGKPATSIFGATTSSASSKTDTTSTTATDLTKTTTTTASIFGGAPASKETTAATSANTSGSTTGFSFASASKSLFGQAPAASTPTSSAFGGSASAPSAFGGTATTAAPAIPPGFGGIATSTSAPTPSTPSVFGGASTTGGSTSIFGGSATAATTTAAATSTTSTPSVFGGTAAATSTPNAPSIFGAPTSSASFGSTPATTASIFGAPSTTTTAGTTSIFGGGQSAFGATSTAASSVFGAPSTPIFGGTTTTTQSAFGGSAFGQPSSTASAFGTNSTFGQSGGTSVFGGSSGGAQTSGSVFGGTPTTAAPSAGVFGQTSGANTSSSGVFGTSGGGGGGGLFSGLGGKPSAENANKNVFGGNVAFGGAGSAPTSGGNTLFGQSGGQSFGQFSGQSAFGGSSGNAFGTNQSGSFSSNQGSIATAGFGGFSTPPKQSGSFGGAPAFGGQASFGSTSPTFGGGAVFGASPSFGGPQQQQAGTGGTGIFGGGAGGASSSQNAGFASFASAQAPSFGALAGTGGTSTFGGGASQGFGDMTQQQQQPMGFGGANSGNQGFGSPAPSFGGAGGGSPAFSAYRG